MCVVNKSSSGMTICVAFSLMLSALPHPHSCCLPPFHVIPRHPLHSYTWAAEENSHLDSVGAMTHLRSAPSHEPHPTFPCVPQPYWTHTTQTRPLQHGKEAVLVCCLLPKPRAPPSAALECPVAASGVCLFVWSSHFSAPLRVCVRCFLLPQSVQ